MDFVAEVLSDDFSFRCGVATACRGELFESRLGMFWTGLQFDTLPRTVRTYSFCDAAYDVEGADRAKPGRLVSSASLSSINVASSGQNWLEDSSSLLWGEVWDFVSPSASWNTGAAGGSEGTADKSARQIRTGRSVWQPRRTGTSCDASAERRLGDGVRKGRISCRGGVCALSGTSTTILPDGQRQATIALRFSYQHYAWRQDVSDHVIPALSALSRTYVESRWDDRGGSRRRRTDIGTNIVVSF